MKSLSFALFLALMAVASANDQLLRFLVTPSTVVKTTTSISTIKLASTVFCFSTAAKISACRKRRGIEEKYSVEGIDPALISPTEKMTMESSAPAFFLTPGSNPPVVAVPDIQDSRSMVEVQISGLNNVCQARQSLPFFGNLASRLGITVVTTTTSTSVVSVTSFTATSTRPFTVVNCTPAGFAFAACP